MFITDEQKSRLQVAASRVITAKTLLDSEVRSLDYAKGRVRDASNQLEQAQERYNAVTAELVDPLNK